jgi:hypothetical protein
VIAYSVFPVRIVSAVAGVVVVQDEVESAGVAGVCQLADQVALGGAATENTVDGGAGRGQHLQRVGASKDHIAGTRAGDLVDIALGAEIVDGFFEGQPIVSAYGLRLRGPVGGDTEAAGGQPGGIGALVIGRAGERARDGSIDGASADTLENMSNQPRS